MAQDDGFAERDLHLLKYGRHIRATDGSKIVVGRSQGDNELILSRYQEQTDVLIQPIRFPGPAVLLPGAGASGSIRLAAAICVGYGKVAKGERATVTVRFPRGREELTVLGVLPADVRHLLV